jgi:mannose-6-phosphate isomerase-like protein (cupin superfamily)
MRPALAALVLVLVLVLEPSRATAQTATALPEIGDVDGLVAMRPLAATATTRVDEVARTAAISVHLIQTRGVIRLHHHAAREETAILLRGQGDVELAGRWRRMNVGEWVVVPRGAPHAFRCTDPVPAVALAIYAPPWDGVDRVLEPSVATGTSEINELLERTAAALRAKDVEALRALTTLEADAIQRKLRGVAADPLGDATIDALARFLRVGAPFDDVTQLGFVVKFGSSAGPVEVSVHLKRGAAGWRVNSFWLQHPAALATAPDFRSEDAIDLADLEPDIHFGVPTDGDFTRPMPSVRGVWSSAETIEVMAVAGYTGVAVFRKRDGRWQAARP